MTKFMDANIPLLLALIMMFALTILVILQLVVNSALERPAMMVTPVLPILAMLRLDALILLFLVMMQTNAPMILAALLLDVLTLISLVMTQIHVLLTLVLLLLDVLM